MSMENLNYENEIWRDIPEYEGLYQASNLGRIKSLQRTKQRLDGTHIQNVNERILISKTGKYGYLRLLLHKNSIRKTYSVHRLVWSAFNGPIPEGMQINHINEIKTDNRLENLNLMTPKENTNWGTRNYRAGKANSISQMHSRNCKKVMQYDLQGNLVKEWFSAAEAERNTGYFSTNITRCCRGGINSYKGFKWQYKQ